MDKRDRLSNNPKSPQSKTKPSPRDNDNAGPSGMQKKKHKIHSGPSEKTEPRKADFGSTEEEVDDDDDDDFDNVGS
jgi:hypothetical protein